MGFTQLIEVGGADEQALLEHLTSWHAEQHGTAPGYQRARLYVDADRRGRHVIAVDFTSEEHARQNNDRPETTRWADRLRQLGTVPDDGYRNLRHVDTTD